jgi:DNA-binding beta-propeller fold protein YncE
MLCIRKTVVLVLAFAALGAVAFGQSGSGYKITRHIAVGGEGGWDYLTFDADAHRLYIARATRVMVVDTETGKQVGEISDTSGVHGVALVPKLGLGVTSNGKADTASIFELKTLKTVATVKTGNKPDAILFDDASGYVLTFNGKSNNITVIDPQKALAVDTIALPGRPETGVTDGKGRVFVNLEDKNSIAVLDLKTKKVLNTWSLDGCDEPTGLSMDRKNRRLFSGCHNGVLVVVDADSGKNLQKLSVGKGVDATAFDAQAHLVFTSNGEGSISIIHQDAPDGYRNAATVTTLQGAKTMAFDPAHHRLYTVALASPGNPNGGGFEILVIEP